MSLDPITAGLDLIDDVVKSYTGDKSQIEQEAFKLKLLTIQQEAAQLASQAAIDANEASSASIFIAGWRPALGWVCVTSFSWQYVILPIVMYVCAISGHTVPTISFDLSSMSTILMGMLGLGAMHVVENVSNKKGK